jgi:putative peptidoglycan lipid II flippase
MGAGRRIALSAALIMFGNIVSRVLGLAREQTIAALLGATPAASVFTAAIRVPTMVYDLLIGGAMTAALVPVFSEHAARDERRAAGEAEAAGAAGAAGDAGDRASGELAPLASAVACLALLVLIPAVAVLVLLARPLMAVLGVGFAPEVQEQGILLVRLALPSVVLMGTSAVLMGVAYALNRVALPSLAPAVYNAGIIVCALVLFRWFGVASLVVGVLAGALGQVLLQVPGLRGVPLRLRFAPRDPGVRRILRLYAPVAAGLLVSAAVVTLDTRLASQTGGGSLAAMRYATTLIQFPLGLVASALSFASLPVLSRYGAGGARQAGFQRTLAMGLKAALLLVTPAMVGLLVLREPVVRLVFQRGALDAGGTHLIAVALSYYAPQLPFVAVDQLLIAAFYALQNTTLPVVIGVVGAGAYAAVALGTVGVLGMPGLVLANTLQNSVHAVILMVLIWRAAGGLRRERLGAAAARIGVAGTAMALLLWLVQRQIPPPSGTLPLVVYLAVAGTVSGGLYVASLAALRSEELVYVWSTIRRRAGRGRSLGA